MGVFRKENGSIIRKSGRAVVDLVLNKLSNHAVANSAVSTKFEEVDNDIDQINASLAKKKN